VAFGGASHERGSSSSPLSNQQPHSLPRGLKCKPFGKDTDQESWDARGEFDLLGSPLLTNLGRRSLMQDAVCDNLPYSSTGAIVCRSKLSEVGRVFGDECGDSDLLCSEVELKVLKNIRKIAE
jgi:hypothetical protein